MNRNSKIFFSEYKLKSENSLVTRRDFINALKNNILIKYRISQDREERYILPLKKVKEMSEKDFLSILNKKGWVIGEFSNEEKPYYLKQCEGPEELKWFIENSENVRTILGENFYSGEPLTDEGIYFAEKKEVFENIRTNFIKSNGLFCVKREGVGNRSNFSLSSFEEYASKWYEDNAGKNYSTDDFKFFMPLIFNSYMKQVNSSR